MTQKTTIVGIDIAKEKIDAAIRSVSAGASFADTTADRGNLLGWLRRHRVSTAVMEASGGYESRWAKILRAEGIEVRIVDPKRVRHFARSAGRLAKNDPIDAAMIAWFAETFPDAVGRPHDPRREELDHLVSARTALAAMKAQIANYGEHDQPTEVRKAHQAIDKTLTAQVARLEAVIAAKIEQTAQFAERAAIIESVPGLGQASVAGLIAFLPELGLVSDKAAAALVGVAPYDDDSGKHRGRRFIKGGRRKLRNLLFMPIVAAATRCNPVLGEYYKRLIAKGKAAKVALIACMRKLIIILNTLIARGQKWDPNRHAPA
jgi:transposase